MRSRPVHLLLATAATLLLACARTDLAVSPSGGPTEKSFLAQAPQTKAVIGTDHSLTWEPTDRIWVEGCTAPFSIKNFTGGTNAIFSGPVEGEIPSYRAVLPYDASVRINSKGTLDCVLPALQQVSGTRVVSYPLAVAKTATGVGGEILDFQHLTSAVLFTLAPSMEGVSQIVLRGNAGDERLAGTYTVAFEEDGTIASRTLSSPKSAIVLQGTFVPGGTYCFNVNGEAAFPGGMTLEVSFEDGCYGSVTSTAPVTFTPGAYINLSNSLSVVKHAPSGKISSLEDWREMLPIAQADGDVSRFCTAGEILLDADLTLQDSDRLAALSTPLNGNGHTLTLNRMTRPVVDKLYADIHDLALDGTLVYSGSSYAAPLAGVVGGTVTLSDITSDVLVTAQCSDPASYATVRAAGLIGSLDGDNAVVSLKDCAFTGTVRTLQYVHSLGGLVAQGGSGTAPKVILDGCSFTGAIEYNQTAAPVGSAGRIGGLVGDASRQVEIRSNCISAGTLSVRLGGFALGSGGIGGLVGRTTKQTGAYTMRLMLDGVTNQSDITVYDALQDDRKYCGQVVGNATPQKPVNALGEDLASPYGTESGSLTFVASAAPAPTSGHFGLCQISGRKVVGSGYPGNYMSYLLQTSGGKVIVIDGGWTEDAPTLRSFIAAAGGHVDAWFLSHPHQDHFQAMLSILNDPQGISVGKIYYSRSEYAAANATDENGVAPLYAKLAALGPGIAVDIQTPGQRLDIDGVGIKVLSVSDDALSHDMNNSSMVLRIWDDTHSVVFLGDAGILEGRKLLATCRADLDCDYLQLAHHGNRGCEAAFYQAVNFSYALVPTSQRIWEAPEATDSLDGGETRRWIEAKIGADHIFTSYGCPDWWLKSGPANPTTTLPPFSEIPGGDYFD